VSIVVRYRSNRLCNGCQVWLNSSGWLLINVLVVKTLIGDLIETLRIQPAARTLPSRIADRTVSGELAIVPVRGFETVGYRISYPSSGTDNRE
jgi:hypothetical protein